MPELPDIEVYCEALRERVVGTRLDRAKILNPFVLRTVDPPLLALHGLEILGVERLGKRIVLGLEGDHFVVIHLMISGRLLWSEEVGASVKTGGKLFLARFEFASGTLILTEASTKKRASVHLVRGRDALNAMNPGGLEPLECSEAEFRERLSATNRTLKRALTSPQNLSGVGNAYSDEILHAARLSPVRLTQALKDEEWMRLHAAMQSTLRTWHAKLQKERKGKFPGRGQVTAFRPDFAAHGKFGQPCPVCGMPIQRIQYAENETNYCARCQNEDRVLADRSLSRLLKEDWPKTLEELVGD